MDEPVERQIVVRYSIDGAGKIENPSATLFVKSESGRVSANEVLKVGIEFCDRALLAWASKEITTATGKSLRDLAGLTISASGFAKIEFALPLGLRRDCSGWLSSRFVMDGLKVSKVWLHPIPVGKIRFQGC